MKALRLAQADRHPLRRPFRIPQIEHPRDAIIKVTSCAICGSDLHLYNGFMPGMRSGDIVGHEFMGEVWRSGRRRRAR